MIYVIVRAFYAVIIVFGLVGIPSSVQAKESDAVFKIESCNILGDDSAIARICFIGSGKDGTLTMACVEPYSDLWVHAMNARVGDLFTVELKTFTGIRNRINEIHRIIRNKSVDVTQDACSISRYSNLRTNFITSGDS